MYSGRVVGVYIPMDPDAQRTEGMYHLNEKGHQVGPSCAIHHTPAGYPQWEVLARFFLPRQTRKTLPTKADVEAFRADHSSVEFRRMAREFTRW